MIDTCIIFQPQLNASFSCIPRFFTQKRFSFYIPYLRPFLYLISVFKRPNIYFFSKNQASRSNAMPIYVISIRARKICGSQMNDAQAKIRFYSACRPFWKDTIFLNHQPFPIVSSSSGHCVPFSSQLQSAGFFLSQLRLQLRSSSTCRSSRLSP